MRTDYILSERDTFSAAYTIDDGNSLIPQADPLFGSVRNAAQPGGEPGGDAHHLARNAEHVPRRLFARRVRLRFRRPDLVSRRASLSSPAWARRHRHRRRRHHHAGGAITSAGPNNAANVWNRRNLFTYTDGVQIIKGRHQISAGVWFQRVQDNEDTASRQLGQASFASLPTFLQGTVTRFRWCPTPTNSAGEASSARLISKTPSSCRRNLTFQAGLRYEFTTGWNEESGRAANYVTDSNGVLETTPRVGKFGLHAEQREASAWPARRPRLGCFRQRQNRRSRRLRHVLFADRRSQLPAQLAAALQRLGFLQRLAAAAGSDHCPASRPPPGTIFAPQGVQPNAKTPTVEEWNFTIEQQLEPQHRAARGLRRLVRLSRLPEHRSQHHSRARFAPTPAGCSSGGNGTVGGLVPAGRAVHSRPRREAPNPYLGAGFFWYTEGNSSYNALQIDVIHRFSNGLQFRANYTWSKNLDMNSALTGAQASNQAQMILDRNDLPRDWGPSAYNMPQLRPASPAPTSCRSARQAWQPGLRNSGERLAGQRHRHAQSGFPFTPADRLQPLRRWRHPQSRPAVAESRVHRARGRRAIRTSGSIRTRSFCRPPALTAISAAAFSADRAWPNWMSRCSKTPPLPSEPICNSAPKFSTC